MKSSLHDLFILGYPFVTKAKTKNFLFLTKKKFLKIAIVRITLRIFKG